MSIKVLRRAAASVFVPVVAVTAALTLSPAAPSAAASAKSPSLTERVVTLTNQHRAKNRCPRLKVNAALTRAAKRHSGDMATKRYFSHKGSGNTTFVVRARYSGYRYAVGENIAWGQRTSLTVVRAWMNSPGHRRNILNCKARSIGVGVAYSKQGVPYWTQVFGRV